MEEKIKAKNLLNGRVCDNCRYHTYDIEEVTYLSGEGGDIKIDDCMLDPSLDLYGITNKYTCKSWEGITETRKNYFEFLVNISNPVQGQVALDSKTGKFMSYDGYRWNEL